MTANAFAPTLTTNFVMNEIGAALVTMTGLGGVSLPGLGLRPDSADAFLPPSSLRKAPLNASAALKACQLAA
jgi:hypothetical protein